MESFSSLDYAKFKKIVDSGEENVAREVIKAIENMIVPAEYEKEVMFNTIEVLAKKLDNIGKNEDDAKAFGKQNAKKKKKKNFLKMPFIEENEKIRLFSEKAVEVHLEKGSDNTDPKELEIFAKLAAAPFPPPIAQETLEAAISSAFPKHGAAPALTHLYKSLESGAERYKTALLSTVSAVFKSAAKNDAASVEALLSQVPGTADGALFDLLFSAVASRPEMVGACLNALSGYVLYREGEREKALMVLLHFAHHQNTNIRNKSISAVLSEAILKQSAMRKMVEAETLRNFKKALAVETEAILPDEMKDDFIANKIEDAKVVIVEQINKDFPDQTMTKTEIEKLKTKYIETAKKTALLLRQKAEMDFKENGPKLARKKVKVLSQAYCGLAFKRPNILETIPSLLNSHSGHFRHYIFSSLRAVIHAFSLNRNLTAFLDKAIFSVTRKTFLRSPPGLAIALVFVNYISSTHIARKRAQKIAKTKNETDLGVENDGKGEKSADFVKKCGKSADFVKKCLFLLKNADSASFKAHLLASVFPLLSESERRKYFEAVFSGLGLEALKTFLDFVFGKTDRYVLPPSRELLVSLGAKGVFGLDLEETAKNGDFGADNGFETENSFEAGEVRKWAEVFKGELEFTAEEKRDDFEGEDAGEGENDMVKTSVWVFKKLHYVVKKSDNPDILKALELINHSLKNVKLFSPQRLRVVIDEISQLKETSILLFRTLIQIYLLYPETTDLILSVLLRYLKRKPWRDPMAWEGFMKCVTWTIPSSIQILAQIKTSLVLSAIDNDQTLKTKLESIFMQNPANLDCLHKEVRQKLRKRRVTEKAMPARGTVKRRK